MRIQFRGSPTCSVGIEWELELVLRSSGELSSGATQILTRLSEPYGGEHPKAKHELLESCVEVITGVCTTVQEALDDLAVTVGEVAEEAARLDLDVMCSGTHPFTDWAPKRSVRRRVTPCSSSACSTWPGGCRSSACTSM